MKKVICTALISLNIAAVYLNYNVAFAADKLVTKTTKTTYGANAIKLILKDESGQTTASYNVNSLADIDSVLENTHGLNDANRAKILKRLKLAKQRKSSHALINQPKKNGVTVRTEHTNHFEDKLADKLVNGKYKGIDIENIVKVTQVTKAQSIESLIDHGNLSPLQRDKLQSQLDAKHQSR